MRRMHQRRIRILFLCTGNSCRSQMAEGWANHLGGQWVEARSAGIEAHGKNPRAIAVMKEADVDISHQASKTLTPEMIDWADLVVTVCGHADEHCPALPAGVHKRHWPIEDPARANGTEEEILGKYRAVRDEIKNRVAGLLDNLNEIARGEATLG